MNDLLNNFFNISKVKKIKDSFELFPFVDIITQSLSDLDLLTDKFKAEISIINSSELPQIFGDKENLKLMLY